MTPCFTKDKFVRVRVRVSVRVLDRVAGAKYAGKNVVGHDVLGQDDGNPLFLFSPRNISNYTFHLGLLIIVLLSMFQNS